MTDAEEAAASGLQSPPREHSPEITLERVSGVGAPSADEVPATEEVLVLDFGGQYSQLIARRIRECGVFAEMLPSDIADRADPRARAAGPRPLRRPRVGL